MNYNYYSEIASQPQVSQNNNVNNTNMNTNINPISVTNTNENTNTNNDNKKDMSYIHKIKFFLTSPTGTILAVAFGVAIGNAFKEFVSSIVVNILQPILILIISKTYLNSYYDLTSFISPQKNVLNIELFSSSLITFLLVVITVYAIHETFLRRL